MNTLLSVALGGAIGAACRHLAGQLVPAPWGTFAVNVFGSLLMGLLVGWLGARGGSPGNMDTVRLFLAVGVLGGFTTFSAFSLDAVLLLQRGQWGAFAAYGGGSVALSLVALSVGLSVGLKLGPRGLA